MLGLLVKDWYLARKYCRPLLLIAVVFAAVSVFSENSFFAVYPLLLGALLPVTLHAYDERSGFLRYACALPVRRRDVVAVRYLELALSLLLGLAVLGLARIAGALSGAAVSGTVMELLVMTLLALVVASILLPLAFRFGTERARLMMFLVVGVLCAVVLMSSESLPGLLPRLGSTAGYIVLAIALLAPLLSYLLSARIYQKKAL